MMGVQVTKYCGYDISLGCHDLARRLESVMQNPKHNACCPGTTDCFGYASFCNTGNPLKDHLPLFGGTSSQFSLEPTIYHVIYVAM